MSSKKDAKKAAVESANDNNAVVLSGTVMRPKQMEKVCRFTLDVATTTEKGNVAHAYVNIVWFNGDSEDTVSEGERVGVNGSIRTGSYEKDGRKIYTTDVVANEVIFS